MENSTSAVMSGTAWSISVAYSYALPLHSAGSGMLPNRDVVWVWRVNVDKSQEHVRIYKIASGGFNIHSSVTWHCIHVIMSGPLPPTDITVIHYRLGLYRPSLAESHLGLRSRLDWAPKRRDLTVLSPTLPKWWGKAMGARLLTGGPCPLDS